MTDPNNLLSDLKLALDAFQTSQSSFHIAKTVSVRGAPDQAENVTSQNPPPTVSANLPLASNQQPARPARFLDILDSSFNPPSLAHSFLARHAIQNRARSQGANGLDDDSSHRLLLLFSTHNADKSPSPALFEHRLAMMVLFAQDLVQGLGVPSFDIDIGLTRKPYYADKAAAIDDSGAYQSPEAQRGPGISHIIGSDTLLRILDPKYYEGFDPPLSALDEFVQKHGLLVITRPKDGQAPVEMEEDEGVQLWKGLRDGDLEAQGGQRAWADKIEMVESEEEIADISSTRVRLAVQHDDWEVAKRFCTPRVYEWLTNWKLYTPHTKLRIPE